MKLFADTANLEELAHIGRWGIAEGVTTNQTIFSREVGVNLETRVHEILDCTHGPVSVELTTKMVPEMVDEAIRYFEWNQDRIVVKVAMSGDGIGLEVMNKLRSMGIPVNATCMMNFLQALLAVKAGARYVSLFYRRAMDYATSTNTGLDPLEEIHRTRAFINDCEVGTEIIVGSIREPDDVGDAFTYGAHIVTVPYKILTRMPHHPKSEETIAEFDRNWEKFLAGANG